MSRLALIVLLLVPVAPHAQQGTLPVYLLEIPKSIDTILIAETETSTLHKFVSGDDGLQPQREIYMSVGQNGVGYDQVARKVRTNGVPARLPEHLGSYQPA
jgi:hypothetical protein